MWSAFLLGIAVSLAANIAAVSALEWKPVLVAGCPPVVLLLSVELLGHRPADVAGVQGEGNGLVLGESPLQTRIHCWRGHRY